MFTLRKLVTTDNIHGHCHRKLKKNNFASG